MAELNYKKQLTQLILFTCIVKLIVAGFVELGNDEVYYWTYALQPDWNHFDHPPMVGLLIRLTSFNLHFANDVTLRLGAIVGCAVSSVFIFNIGKILSSERMGWYATLVYNCSVYTAIISGLFILPDSPQMPFWTASLYLMCRLIFKDEVRKISTWLLLGLMIGLATLSKVHGLYLWAGFGLFILLKRTKWLLNYRLYVAVIVSLLFVLPIVYWNIQNDFITYKFHSERVTHTSLQWNMLLQEIVGEFAYQNPVIFILLIAAIVYLLRSKKIFPQSNAVVWLLCMSLPMILLFWTVALFNPTLPHWSGPAYIPLYFFTAKYLEDRNAKTYPAFIKIAGSLVFVVLLAGVLLAQLAPFNLGSKDKEKYGEYCPTLDISGWKTFSKNFDTLVKSDIANHIMQPESPIVVGKWFPGGHLEFYTSRAAGLRVLGVGPLQDIHKFAWLNKERKPLQLGNDAYCIVPSNVPFNVAENYAKYFTTIDAPATINQMRGGNAVRYFYVYRLKNCKEVPIDDLQEMRRK
jgi:4-amino-4-deoxy-L-arabinose transferase-like glycosyltransferase